MSNYRKRMFRGAKIEDCILDFIDMEKELTKSIKVTTGDERLPHSCHTRYLQLV